MMRPNQPCAAAAAREPHASHARTHHASTSLWCSHGVCDARFASCGRRWSIRPHHYARFSKPC
eukprot:11200949-Lingulodinium_polyedra.AAC.1